MINKQIFLTSSSAVSECPSLPYPPKPQLKACRYVSRFNRAEIELNLVVLIHSNRMIGSAGDLLDVRHWKMGHLDVQSMR